MTFDPKMIASNSNWSEIFDAANLYVQQEKWQKAIAAYYRVIELNSSFFWSYHQLAEVLTKLQRWDEAAIIYHRAIQLDPNFFWSHHNLGDVLMKLQRWDEAALIYRRAIQLDSSFFWSHHNLGDVLSQLQKWDEAIATYFHAIQLDIDASLTYQKLGTAFRDRGNLTQSIQDYRQVVRYPEQYPIYGNLREQLPLLCQIANTLAQKNQIIGAIIVYYMVLEIEPARLVILPKLEKLLQKHHHLKQSISSRKQQIESNPLRLSYYQSEMGESATDITTKKGKEKFLLTSDRTIDPNELESLCQAVGWKSRPLDKVQKAIARSFLIVAIWEISKNPRRLIGFARVISDGVFHATLSDMVIHPDFHSRGLGKKVIKYIVTQLTTEGVNDIILFTSPSVVDFYHSLGFICEPNNLKWMLWCPN